MELTRDIKKRLKALEKAYGYGFKKLGHLQRALTHRSYANEQKLPATDHNERYEFLGDAVLQLSVSHLLMETFPHQPEGELSKLRAAVVNETQLADCARAVGLGQFLYLGKGEDQTGGRDKPSLLADCYEAVLGAIYLDRGFAKAAEVVQRHFAPLLKLALAGTLIRDFKTRLQEVAQGRFRQVPRYRLVRELGPDHSKQFEVELFIGEQRYGVGKGTSKKSAEQEAAKEALDGLEQL